MKGLALQQRLQLRHDPSLELEIDLSTLVMTEPGGFNVSYFLTIRAALAIGMVASVMAQPARAATETLLHIFNGTDGSSPSGSLISQSGKLFGTTTFGGGNSGCLNEGCGVVFSLDADGSNEQTLHTFTGGTDGGNPYGSLIAVQGSLYGVTSVGGDIKNCHEGDQGCGVVFRIAKDGSFSVVHTFEGYPGDGASPFSSLLYANGLLYGTTYHGGSHDSGTAFSLTLDGQETVLHSFRNSEGVAPSGGLIKVGKLFYGTTSGGKHRRGNVFSMNASGKTKSVYAFQGGGDGSGAISPLVALGGLLYGTTSSGGPAGAGTVFSLTSQGQKAVIASFTAEHANPSSPLTVVNGTFYGTTFGGTSGNAILYSVTPQGELSTVFDFGPSAGIEGQLFYRNDMFFGAAFEDAPPNNVAGAIYSVTP